MELYIAYTGRQPPHLVLALAGGAAVAPSSLDPWIFLLFWANWHQPAKMGSSRRLVHISTQQKQQQQQQQQQQYLPARRTLRSSTSSSSDPRQHNHVLLVGQSRLPPYTIRWNTGVNRQNKL